MATRPPMMPPVNEKEHTVSRITREGKNITYKLSVMQQPERARACGAGAKSSADRRPVDPPPVVELRIFESDPNDDLHKTDITFAYNANFFLFATLETARPIAHGRVAGPPTCPVLTGVPVAGIAYLDRPSQAGYFIFPDLSVRHEGRYRLSFHLYEDIKDPKDADRDAPMPNLVQPLSSKPTAPQSSLNFRLEVKSVPFTVYSAKKFPGLATSTSLSRIIAEQGCRVRIRRDVRMRRRGDKRTEDFESNEERVYAAQRQAEHRYSTPDAYAPTPIERPRSTSTSTVEPAFPYGPEAQRRPSAPEYGFPQPYQRPMPAAPPAPAPPAPPAHASPYPSHLSFGTSQPSYPAPQLPPTPQSTATTNPYSPHLSYSHTRNPSSSGTEYESAGYPYPQPPPSTEQSSYPKAALPPLRLEPPKGFNNAQPVSGEFRSSDPNAYQSLNHPPAPRSQTPTPSSFLPSLPPLSALSGGEYMHNMPSSMVQSPSHDMMAPNKRVLYENPSSKLSKRSHEESFGFEERPLHNGMRPDTEEYPSMDRKLSVASSAAPFSEPRDEMAYKRANGKMTPCLQVNLDTDPLRADHQLQQALRLNASRDELTPTSRKHSRSHSGSSCSTESDGITDVSGRFDDADEFDSCNDDDYYGDGYQHSVKRRRSNDWPVQNHQKGQDNNDRGGGSRYHENSFSRRWRLYHDSGGCDSNGRRSNYNNSTGSPRATAAGTKGKNGPLPRPRRSRFVEGSMNDSVSEKPPSIFLRDDWHLEGEKGLDHTAGAGHKSSGIFRFGKAIASAFNPFGGWGSVSDVWKGGSAEENQQQHQQPENDDIARVQQAYEELKKAGFKGTVKGAYTQGGAQAESSNLPDQTWKAIQEKMDYKQPSGAVNHLRQTSGESQNTTSSTSIRTLTDLRKAKSSLGITSVKNNPGRGSEESECPDLRKQKSRKDILRQAKLLKKVSNLEDKLTRAKRELSELRGDQKEEEPVPARTMALEAIAQQEKPYYPKKFVPGALPTLPSERCLEEQAAAEDNEISALPPLPSPLRNASPTLPHGNKHATTPKSTPKSKTKSPKAARQLSASLTTDSPSLKRKSLDPESLESAQVAESNKQDNDQDQPMANSDPLSTITNTTPGNRLRKAKFQKMGKGDSPGSVERKQSQERVETVDNSNNLLTPGTGSGRGKGRRKSRYLNPTSPKSSPSARRSPSVTTTPSDAKSGPSLRMKKGQRDLRSASADTGAHTEAQGDRMDCDDDDFDGYSSSSSPSKNQHPHQDTFYMQGQHHLDPDQNTTSPSPSPSKSRSRSRSRSRYEYIPPVPPLPKDLAATAAKVDRRLAKELGRRKGSLRRTAQKEDFEWPEDIF